MVMCGDNGQSGLPRCDHNVIPCRRWFRAGWVCVRCNRWFRVPPSRDALYVYADELKRKLAEYRATGGPHAE